MELLIKEGKIIDTNDEPKLFFNITREDIEEKFIYSKDRVLSFIDGYEVEKYPNDTNLDIYYLYYFIDNPSKVKEEVDSLLSNSKVDFHNNSIFWDVLNNFIIVIGKENLKALLYELEISRWKMIDFNKMSEENKKTYINASCSNVYKRVLNID
ncbi:MAG: hypothetical protein IJ572_02540 [Bacilli bacterium]|nr:hypothetical protein [Bacilli bacterium]